MINPCHEHCAVCRKPLTPTRRLVARICADMRCGLAYRAHILRGGRTCLACGRTLAVPPAAGRESLTCGDVRCLMFAAAHGMRTDAVDVTPRCAVCGVLMPRASNGRRLCGLRQCHDLENSLGIEKRSREQAEARQRVYEALFRVASERRRSDAGAAGIGRPSRYPVTLVPHLDRPLTPPSVRRQREFRRNLREHLREATALRAQAGAEAAGAGSASALTPTPPPAGRPAADQAVITASCSACRGYCCRRGGNHAYLHGDTLERFMRAHPTLSQRQVWKAYIDRLPGESVEDSCIYHGARGCGLPEEMRSTTCNSYFCAGLQNWQEQRRRGGPARAYIAAADTSIVHAAFFDGATDNST